MQVFDMIITYYAVTRALLICGPFSFLEGVSSQAHINVLLVLSCKLRQPLGLPLVAWYPVWTLTLQVYSSASIKNTHCKMAAMNGEVKTQQPLI